MRRVALLLVILSVFFTACASSSRNHTEENWLLITQMYDAVRTQVDSLHLVVSELREVTESLRAGLPPVGASADPSGALGGPRRPGERENSDAPALQCAATTHAGTRCSRLAEPGSLYCWQHTAGATTEPPQALSGPSPSSSFEGGRTIYTGPRGGRYYINSHGKKTYVRRCREGRNRAEGATCIRPPVARTPRECHTIHPQFVAGALPKSGGLPALHVRRLLDE